MLTLMYERLSCLHASHLSCNSSPPFLSLRFPPPLCSSLFSSLLPASPERRSHAADLLCAIWLTSCHPYPRRGWLCRAHDWRNPPLFSLLLVSSTPEQKGWEKHTGRKNGERKEWDKGRGGKERDKCRKYGRKKSGNWENCASCQWIKISVLLWGNLINQTVFQTMWFEVWCHDNDKLSFIKTQRAVLMFLFMFENQNEAKRAISHFSFNQWRLCELWFFFYTINPEISGTSLEKLWLNFHQGPFMKAQPTLFPAFSPSSHTSPSNTLH